MAGVGNLQAAIAAQREVIVPEFPSIMLDSSILWGRIGELEGEQTNSRPTRIPICWADGGAFSVPQGGNLDGTPLGRGTGPQEIAAYASPATYIQASEWTMQADLSTNSDAKAIANYVTLTHTKAAKSMAGYMDVVSQMAGDNIIDTIVTVGTGTLTVNNANKFKNLQLIDVFTGTGGTYVTTLQVQVSAINTNTLLINGSVPGTVLAGMALGIRGSTAASSSGALGLLYVDTNLDIGTYYGIPRASYPSMLVASGIDLKNQALTPSAMRALQLLQVYATGETNEGGQPVIHMGPDMLGAWESNYLGPQQVTVQNERGESLDMLPKMPARTIGGREVLGKWGNPTALPGRIDFMDLSFWKRLMVKDVGLLSWGGQTELPIVSSDGGYASATIMYTAVQMQLVCLSAREQSFCVNAAVPKFVLGR